MAKSGNTGHGRRVASIVGAIAYLLAGPLIWIVQFSSVYALHTLACAASNQPVSSGWLSFSMMVITVGFASVALAVLVCGRRVKRALGVSDEPKRDAYDAISGLLIVLSIVAVLWSGVTMALLEPCIAH